MSTSLRPEWQSPTLPPPGAMPNYWREYHAADLKNKQDIRDAWLTNIKHAAQDRRTEEALNNLIDWVETYVHKDLILP